MKRFCVALGLFFTAITLPLVVVAQSNSQFKSSSPIHIGADKLEVDQGNSVATFSGNVEAVQQEIHLRSETMVVHYLKNSKEDNNISSIEVFGNVVLSRPGETAKGDKGVYDVVKDTIHLTGNVVLSKDNNVVQGNNLVYNLKTGKSQLSGGKTGKTTSSGRVKGVFTPQK